MNAIPRPAAPSRTPDQADGRVTLAGVPVVRPRVPPRGRIYDSILDTVGGTPLVRLPRLETEEGLDARLALKLEFFNPLGSVKDRIGLAMVEAAEADGLISPERSTLVEPTSGNTGIALAFVAAAKGYRLIVTMPEGASVERRRMSDQAVAELVRRLARRAKVARFSPHDMRRTFIGDLLDAGADLATVQGLAGHASPTTTSRYDRRGDRAKRRAAELLRVPFVGTRS